MHISEITDENIAKPSEVLKVDQEVKVKVLSVDSENKKLALSIKAVEDENSNDEYMKYNDSNEELTLGDLFKGLKL